MLRNRFALDIGVVSIFFRYNTLASSLYREHDRYESISSIFKDDWLEFCTNGSSSELISSCHQEKISDQFAEWSSRWSNDIELSLDHQQNDFDWYQSLLKWKKKHMTYDHVFE